MLYDVQGDSGFVLSYLSTINMQSNKACVDNSWEEPRVDLCFSLLVIT